MPEKSLKNKKIIFTILGGAVLYLVSAAVSYAGFRWLNQPAEINTPISPVSETKSGFRVDLSAPKT